jgi:hypothetical protein
LQRKVKLDRRKICKEMSNLIQEVRVLAEIIEVQGNGHFLLEAENFLVKSGYEMNENMTQEAIVVNLQSGPSPFFSEGKSPNINFDIRVFCVSNILEENEIEVLADDKGDVFTKVTQTTEYKKLPTGKGIRKLICEPDLIGKNKYKVKVIVKSNK